MVCIAYAIKVWRNAILKNCGSVVTCLSGMFFFHHAACRPHTDVEKTFDHGLAIHVQWSRQVSANRRRRAQGLNRRTLQMFKMPEMQCRWDAARKVPPAADGATQCPNAHYHRRRQSYTASRKGRRPPPSKIVKFMLRREAQCSS
jgi:hypothetical protein